MDERDLEERLRARLHVRFDGAVASPALHETVARSLTAKVPAPSPWRRALSGWPRQLLAVAAVIAAVAVVAFTLRFSALPGPVGPSASPTPTPTTSASPSASPSPSTSPSPTTPTASPTPSGLSGTVPPISTAAWSSLTVQPLAGAPLQATTVVPWTGGYVAVGQASAGAPARAWLSRDGRGWIQLPDATFDLDQAAGGNGPVVRGGTMCRNGVLVMTEDASGGNVLWFSSDGFSWSKVDLSGLAAVTPAGNADGAIAVTNVGLQFSSDCTTWQSDVIFDPGATIRSLAAFGRGFVAVGDREDGPKPTYTPVAWWSADGREWSPAVITGRSLDGLALSRVYAGSSGLIATSTMPGVTPGMTSFFTSSDGQSWNESNADDPLGLIASGQGTGSAAGQFAGDGTRLLAYGTQQRAVGPTEYWVSSDGTHWTKLELSGAGAAPLVADDQAQPFLMRDGIFFSGQAASWFGGAVAP